MRQDGDAVALAVTLAELIATRRNELGLSFERMAARARKQGLQVSATSLVNLVNEEPRALPRPDTLRAIAVALDLPQTEVSQAALRSVGLLGPGGKGRSHADVWADITEGLTDEEILQVLEVVRSVVRVIRPTANTSGYDEVDIQ